MASKKKGNAPKNEAEELLRLKELERLRIEKENELKAEAVSFFFILRGGAGFLPTQTSEGIVRNRFDPRIS